MTTGRKPVPTALKVVRGNPGKRPLNEDEPTPPKGIPDAPDYLSPAAAAHWPVVAKQLDDAGILTGIDAQALAMYCEAFATWREAMDMIRVEGPIVKAPSGYPIQSPWLGIANRAHDDLRKLLIEFGMTPSARTRIKATPKDDGDVYAGFVKKRNG